MLYGIYRALDVVCRLLDFAILLYCIMSWFRSRTPFFMWIARFVEPVLAPFRSISMWLRRKTGIPLDISPLLAMFALEIIRSLLWRLLLFLI